MVEWGGWVPVGGLPELGVVPAHVVVVEHVDGGREDVVASRPQPRRHRDLRTHTRTNADASIHSTRQAAATREPAAGPPVTARQTDKTDRQTDI